MFLNALAVSPPLLIQDITFMETENFIVSQKYSFLGLIYIDA
jgi:hypothetical protein